MASQEITLERIKRIILDKDPSANVYLYGSRDRETMKPDSDWDLLILLYKKKITALITSPTHDSTFRIDNEIRNFENQRTDSDRC